MYFLHLQDKGDEDPVYQNSFTLAKVRFHWGISEVFYDSMNVPFPSGQSIPIRILAHRTCSLERFVTSRRRKPFP